MAITVTLNGQQRTFSELNNPAALTAIVDALGLQADRVAIEHNGEIIRRSSWGTTLITAGDKLEAVHFVGGGHH